MLTPDVNGFISPQNKPKINQRTLDETNSKLNMDEERNQSKQTKKSSEKVSAHKITHIDCCCNMKCSEPHVQNNVHEIKYRRENLSSIQNDDFKTPPEGENEDRAQYRDEEHYNCTKARAEELYSSNFDVQFDQINLMHANEDPDLQTITSTNNVTVIPTCSTALQKTQPKRMLRAASNEINHNNSANAKASQYSTTGIDKIRYLHSYRRFQTFNLRVEYMSSTLTNDYLVSELARNTHSS